MYQEILVNIWRGLDSFRGDSEIGTWIYRIAVNTSLSFAGKEYKRMKLNVDLETLNLDKLLIDGSDDNTIKEEQIQTLQIHLNQLNVIDKALMGLLLEDLPTKEIADIIGITEPNVRVKIHNNFRKIDYSLPSSEMFAKAAERYKLTLKRYLVVVPPLLLIDAGITISEFYRWTSIEPINRILLVQAFYIPILLISGFIGYLIWRKRQKPLRDGALQILNDLNEV